MEEGHLAPRAPLAHAHPLEAAALGARDDGGEEGEAYAPLNQAPYGFRVGRLDHHPRLLSLGAKDGLQRLGPAGAGDDHQRLVHHIEEPDGALGAGEAMPPRQEQHVALLPELLGDQIQTAHRQVEDRQIELAAGHLLLQLLLEPLDEPDEHARVELVEPGDHLGEQISADRRQCPERDRAHRLPPQLLQGGFPHAQGIQGALGVDEESLACIRWHHAGRAANHQLGAQLFLERLEEAGEAGLGGAKTAGGSGEPPLIGQHQERLELGKGHEHPMSNPHGEYARDALFAFGRSAYQMGPMIESAPARATAAAPRTAIAGVLLSTVLQAIDGSIVNVAVPQIQHSFAAPLTQLGWTVTGYVLASLVSMPLAASLARRYGTRAYLLVSVALFTATSVACGLAPGLGWLIFFRILQGFGAGGLLPIAQGFLMSVYTGPQRGRAIAILGVATVLGPLLGPPLGGVLTDAFG